MGKVNKWGWMVIRQGYALENGDDGHVHGVVFVIIRRWHPGYWVFYWRTAFKTAFELRMPFYKWFPTALYRFFFGNRDYKGDGVAIKHE